MPINDNIEVFIKDKKLLLKTGYTGTFGLTKEIGIRVSPLITNR